MKQKKNTYRAYNTEYYYQAAQEKLEEWEKIEAERCLEPWEEVEKREAEESVKYYGYLLAEEEEQHRRLVCESQGLSRWC